MISLNRPYDIAGNGERLTVSGERNSGTGYGLPVMGEMEIVYSSREGLSRVYRQLYEERGAMRVAVSPLTCFIAIYPMVANGHVPVFVDIDPETLNMSEEALMAHEDVQAVQVIYLGGNPMRMDKVMDWAKKRGVVVIEDCAQALGAKYGGQMCGTFGEYAVASAVKNVYAVCGGVLIENKNIKNQTINLKNNLLDNQKKIEKNKELSDTSSISNNLDHMSAQEQVLISPELERLFLGQPSVQSCSIDTDAQSLSDNSFQKIPKNSENIRSISPLLMVYKRVKRWLEKRADARKGNIWNAVYGGLLKLKDTRDDSFTNRIHRVPEDVEQEIRAALGHLDEIQAKRTRKAELLMAQIDSTKYRLQQVPEGGESTRNRVIVVALHREAREVIEALRAKGIAANNLTQGYTHPYQEHVRKDKMIGRFYIERLENYERIFPHVVSVPCSPSLNKNEIDYIALSLNNL